MDIATLGVEINTQPAKSGASNLDRFANSARKAETSAKRMASGTRSSTTAMRAYSRATVASARATALQSASYRNVAMQLSQVAQQATATGDPIRALAIQLPDLALGFGAIGIAAGALGGALIPLIQDMLTAEEGANDLGEALRELSEATETLTRSQRALVFGFELERQVDVYDAIVRLRREEKQVEEEILSLTGRSRRAAEARLASLQMQRQELEQQMSALDTALREREEFLRATEETADAERVLGEQMAKVARQTAMAAWEMERMRSAAMDAAREFLVIQDIRSRFAGEEIVMGQDVLQVGRGQPAPSVPRSSGRSGGLSRATQELQQMEERRSQILRALETDQDRYNRKIEEATELLGAGILTQEEYNRVLAGLQKEMQKDSFEEFEDRIASISDALARTVVTGGDMRDALRGIFQGIAEDILSSGIEQALMTVFTGAGAGGGGGFFGLLGNLLSFEGGGYTGPGSRTGGVDGRGGFPAILHPNETVIDHTKTSAPSSGGDVNVQHNWHIAANGDDSVKRIVLDQLPTITHVTKAAVSEENRRNPSFLRRQ